MGKAFVHAVTDGAVVVQRGEHFFQFVQHVLDTDHVQKGFLLTGERGIGQIFGSGRRTHRKRRLRVAALQAHKLLADGFFQVSGKRLGFDHGADFGTRCGQGAHVFGVQGIKSGIDALGQACES